MSRPRAGLIVAAGLAMVLVLVWALRDATSPDEPVTIAPRDAASIAPAPAAPVRAPEPPAIPTAAPEPPEPPERPAELAGHDTIDPCAPVREAAIPPGYESLAAGDVTLAWQLDAPGENDPLFQPAAIGYLITGLLEEAATLTGTTRRDRLTVILYPSRDDFLARTHAPAWSSGIYDGRAVRLPVDPSGELAVPLATLRHELMHAQLHAAVGCMPAWFNEGLAMYFASKPPVRAWIRLLRGGAFELEPLASPTLADLSRERADLAYGASLAMVLFVVAQTGDAGLRQAVARARAAAADGQPDHALWDHVVPGAGPRAVLDALARRVFGAGSGPALDTLLDGAICCWGAKTLRGFGCRGAPPSDKRVWIDETHTPPAVCRSAW